MGSDIAELAAECQDKFVRRQWRECIACCRKVLAAHPERETEREIQVFLAGALQLEPSHTDSDLWEAIEIYEALLPDTPPSSEMATSLHRRLGSVYAKIGSDADAKENAAKAASHYAKALESPHGAPDLRASMQAQLAYCLLRAGSEEDIERARSLLQDALRVFSAGGYSGERDEVSKALRSMPARARASKDDLELAMLVEGGAIERTKELIDAGGDVETRDELGRTLLQIALGEGHTKLVLYLLSAGADVHALDDEQATTLHWAVFSNDEVLLGLALSTPSQVDSRDQTGRTPLTFAVSLGETTSFRWLLRNRADLDLADDDGWTPLHYAAAAGSIDMATELLRRGAKIMPAVSGELPADVARRLGHAPLAALLVRK